MLTSLLLSPEMPWCMVQYANIAQRSRRNGGWAGSDVEEGRVDHVEDGAANEEATSREEIDQADWETHVEIAHVHGYEQTTRWWPWCHAASWAIRWSEVGTPIKSAAWASCKTKDRVADQWEVHQEEDEQNSLSVPQMAEEIPQTADSVDGF